jgi:hypothetical protein
VSIAVHPNRDIHSVRERLVLTDKPQNSKELQGWLRGDLNHRSSAEQLCGNRMKVAAYAALFEGRKVFRAKDLKLSTTGGRTRLSQTSAISDTGRLPMISQATTDATQYFTADAGRMVTPI